ncbi:MAG: T9SS type A sorting domain-containing protein [Flavobacteriales bacterium]|nr:T9SS type A sorting domain-containing protein [Flavobacteriales bacterium]
MRWWPHTAVLLLALGQSGRTCATGFSITYENVPADAQSAVAHAADIWSGIVISNVPIKVKVSWVPLFGSALGLTLPNGRRDFAGAPEPLTWYATALANSITGTELDPGEDDFDVFLDATADWYTGTDGMPGSGQFDLVSIVLHEFGHGLGFVGLSKKDGAIGSLGTLQASDFAPLTTSFPWPQLDTLPSIFDRYLDQQQNGPFTLMDNPGTQLGSVMTSGQVYFNGPIAMADNGGVAPRIYAPSTFALGSSCVHLNESTYPNGDPNELMTPFSDPGHADHWPGPICIAMLQDIGWTIAPDVGIHGTAPLAAATIYPDPATEVVHLATPTPMVAPRIRVIDLGGREVVAARSGMETDVASLSAGTYVLELRSEGRSVHVPFIKR